MNITDMISMKKRDKNEIGMSSIRGGNIVGEHSVQFIGNFETFEIKHTTILEMYLQKEL